MPTAQQEALLLAGALLPPGTGAEAARNGSLDPVRARRYTHQALDGRTVVRLVGKSTAAAEDGMLAFLGFGPATAGAPLAWASRRGLGYVEWVLANDPDRAEAALAAAPEVEQAARLVTSRPGLARRRFEQLAQHVPHSHLPALWEHAGRAFLTLGEGGRRRAAEMFERARQAERVHGLEVDEAARHAVYREFAVAGALRANSFARYVAGLRRHHPPAYAYETLRELALRRVHDGVPPWSALPGELRRLAGAAGLDPDAAEERLLSYLLPLPATRRAHPGFWRHCRAALLRMAGGSAVVRGALLDLFPAPRGGASGFQGWWLQLLDAAGALDGLILPAGQVPAEAAPRRGAAGWVGAYLRHLRPHRWDHEIPAQFFALLPRLAARLAADGEPVVLRVEHDGDSTIDANVADACLEHGIPVADPAAGDRVDLFDWGTSAWEGGVRRDLRFAAADPRFRRLLADAAWRFCRQDRRLEELLLVPGLRLPVEQVLRERAAAFARDGLAGAEDLLDKLAEATSRHTFTRFPAVHAALAATDLAGSLARTLRDGLLDELGWPALDEAVEELQGEELGWSASWPVLVVYNRLRAIAVGPMGRVVEHDLRVPPPGRSASILVRYAASQLLVRWYDDSAHQLNGYWSGAPSEHFPLTDRAGWYQPGSDQGCAFLLPDGGRVAGGRALYPGDRVLPPEAPVCWDGERFWVVTGPHEYGAQPVLRELDPSTGERGPESLPAFLADLRPDPGDVLAPALCSLAPLPADLATTPLGQRGGLVGFRASARLRDGQQIVTIEGVDGRRFAGPDPDPDVQPHLAAHQLAHGVGPVGLVDIPGVSASRLLCCSAGRSYGPTLTLWNAGMELVWPLARVPVGPALAWSGYGAPPRLLPAGTPLVAPPMFWHCLRPRDEAGSRALRGVTEELARELLTAALDDLGAQPGAEPVTVDQMERTASAVERLVPGVSHPRLRRGIVGAARSAALAQRQLGEFSRQRTPLPGGPAVLPALGAVNQRLTDGLLLPALSGLGGVPRGDSTAGFGLRPGVRTADQIHTVGRFFAGDLRPEAVELFLDPGHPSPPWLAMLGRAAAVAFRAASAATSELDRLVLLDLLELWASLPFSADPGSFRVGCVRTWPAPVCRSEDGAFVVLTPEPDPPAPDAREHFAGCRFVERRRRDRSALPPGTEVVNARAVNPSWGTPAQLARFAALVRERGPVPWDPAAPEALADRTGLTRAEAALLWAGLPDLDGMDFERDFLGPERRRLLGLTVPEALAARERLRQLDLDRRWQLLHAAVPDDPAGLWAPLGTGPADESSPVARLAAAWLRLVGRRHPLPGDAVADAGALHDQLRARGFRWLARSPIGLLELLTDPACEPLLTTDYDWWLADHLSRTWLSAVCERGEWSGDRMRALLVELALLLPWAFASRPVGDPLRARLPELLDLARARLDHPGLLLNGPYITSQTDTLSMLRQEFGTRPYRDSRATGVETETADDGLAVAVVAPHGGGLALFFRPALLDAPDARSQHLRHWLATSYQEEDRALVAAIELLRSAGYAAMAGRVRTTPVPDGGFEANPAHAAPALVQEVQATLTLSGDAAVLYLQLLALSEPTDRNLRRWSGWTLQRHRRATAEVLAGGLVVRARRARAQRSLFLPGEWLSAGPPDLPLEAWKAPLYGLERDSRGHELRGALPRVLPQAPLHELFAAAWARVQAGDRPREMSHEPGP